MSRQSNNGGISFLGLLQIVFITLKLTEHITWSWWLVLTPTLIPAAMVTMVLGVVLMLKSK